MKVMFDKKRFFRLSIGSIFLQTVAVFFIISSVVLSILFTNKLIFNSINGSFDGYTVFVTIVCYLAFPMFVQEELNFIVDNICFKEDCVYAHGNFKNKRYKVQYRTKINYEDIVGVEINALRANSKGQLVPLLRPAPFLVLINKKGKKVRIGIYMMSKRTVRNILTELLKRIPTTNEVKFDIDALLKDFKEACWSV